MTTNLEQAPISLAADEQAIRKTMQDYATAWYTGNQALMQSAVHPALSKRAQVPGENGGLIDDVFTAEGLVARVGKTAPDKYAADPKLCKIQIFGIMGNSAAALLEMDAWTDYVHLTKVDGQWKMLHIIWELK